MFGRILIFLLFLASLALSVVVSGEREYLFLFWLPVAFSLTFFFLLQKKYVWYTASVAILIPVFLYRTFLEHLLLLGFLYLLFYGVLSFILDRIRLRLDSMNQFNAVACEKSKRSLGVVEERFRKEERKIEDLQLKTEKIIQLFDMAKDFNTCLTFDELLVLLRDNILNLLPCNRLRLLLLPPAGSGKLRGFQVYAKQVSPWLENELVSEQALNLLMTYTEPRIFEVGTSENPLSLFQKDESIPIYPFWIFPLKIESVIIAFLIVEGAFEKDFYRYQIIAGQLALQIQKTLLYERVRALSLYDGLTQAYVRRHLEERFDEELQRSQLHRLKLSALMVDVDHFKSFNDQLGHLGGDRILREIADVIRANIRSVDLLGRYGGEEFILVFPETDTVGSLEAAERIRSAVAKEKFKVYDEEVRATLSIGLATFPDDLDNKEQMGHFRELRKLLVEKADLALYRAKEDGRNQIKAFSAHVKGRE